MVEATSYELKNGYKERGDKIAVAPHRPIKKGGLFMRQITLPLKDGTNTTVKCYSVSEYMRNRRFISGLYDKFILRQKHGSKGRKKYVNAPITFDIETSHYDVDNDIKKRVTWMYIWQMSINGIVVIGRTWEEWKKLLKHLHDKLYLNDDRRMIIYVHNLPYEYAFFHSRVEFERVFAREARKPISCSLTGDLDGIDFKCSYALTNMSLEKWANECMLSPFKKLTGSLDHSIIRTKKTILSDDELAYCVADVLTMHYCIQERINDEPTKNISYIPLTSTGYVRRDCRSFVSGDREYYKFYNNLKLNGQQFILYNKAFRGGDTHANALWCGEQIDNVYSFDITSSYPFRILYNEFPLSKPITILKPDFSNFNYLMKEKKLFIMDFNLANIKLKDYKHFPIIPVSKCEALINHKSDNGRVVSADALRITITSIELDILIKNYDFEIVSINDIVYHEKKGLLPKKFRDYVINLYKQKTELKGVIGKEKDYMLAKARLNSVYGMCVTNPLNDEILFDWDNLEWYKNELSINMDNEEKISSELERVYSSRNHFLAYEVGVWITAYARLDLEYSQLKIGADAIYWDTDSLKFVNKENYTVFEDINKQREIGLYQLGYTMDEISPVDIKGKRHTIGLWDEEYPQGVKFKTFGAKKYFYIDLSNNKPHITVAGLNGKKAMNYALSELDNDITNIELGFIFPENVSGRTYSIYSEDEFSININGIKCSEKSYMSICETTYELGDTMEHKLTILLAKGINKKVTR